ncbi:MAG: hypothetical protein H6719_04680 [Sandaracinaceae bacterium]|nr:hypothetical protein [Sandaracinaceae bacterium]
MRTILALALVLLAGCGARTTLSVGGDGGAAPPRDAGGRDAGLVDGGGRDAGGRDAGRPDGGPPRLECQRDADCRMGVCRGSATDAPSDLEALRLFCGAADEDEAPAGAACRERAACDRDLCAVAGVCVIPCGNDADCAASELCREVWVQTSASSMESVQACTARVAAPSTVRVAGPESGPALGDVATADSLPNLRPNALVVWRGPAASEPLIERIVSLTPGDGVVFDAFVGGFPDDPAPAWGVGAATVGELVTLMHPNGPASPSSRRGFDVFLSSMVPGPSERVVLQREADGASFDLDLYLVGGNGWLAPDGVVPADLAVAIDELRALYRPTGLAIREVRVHDVVGGLRRRFQVLTGSAGIIGAPPDLPELYRLSAGANRPSVHVFFVRTIEDALGIASGIPGPHAMPGTRASGVAISADLVGLDELAVVIGHEIGHFMGLFHTSELDGRVAEPLPDTPECRTDRDVDGDGYLLPMECRGTGAENLMFWAGSGGEISAQQAQIMRRAYFVE